MSSDINQLLQDLNENFNSHHHEKSISLINSISSEIQIKQLFSSDSDTTLLFFKNIYLQIIPKANTARHKNLHNCLKSFINHWNSLISSFNPLLFLKLCKELIGDEITKTHFLFVFPMSRALANVSDISEYSPILIRILEQADNNTISQFPIELWQNLENILTRQQVEDLIDYFIKENRNEKGVSILVTKDRSELTEKVFSNASLEFICKFVISTPKNVRFDILTISSRIAEAMIIEGHNPEVAFDIIPFVVKEEPNEVAKSAFHPFWPIIINYLEKKESVSALYALQSGCKAKLVSEGDLIKFLKVEEKTELRYRLASFQISLEMLDCKEIQTKLFPIIHDISMTRGNAMFCCLVDHLPDIFQTLIDHDEDYAYDIVNTIMNPIPYDQFLPPFVVKFLNSVENPRDSHFTFNVENVVYKYMKLPLTTITSEMETLIKKINMKIDCLEVDWFGPSLSNSILLVDDIPADLLLEVLSRDTLHISFTPNIIDKLTQICTRKDKDAFLYNVSDAQIRHIFDTGLFTLIEICKKLGLDLDQELSKRNQQPFSVGSTFISNSYINGCIKFLNEPISPSYFGSFIRSLVKLFEELLTYVNEKEKLPPNMNMTFLILADFMTTFMPDQALIFLHKIKDLVEDKEYFNQVESKAINSSATVNSYSKIVTEYLIAEKGPEEALKIDKEKALRAASFNFSIAKQLAPFIDQPIPKFKTFLAFEGIEKHQEWVENCKKCFDEDQWIKPEEENVQPEQNEEEKKEPEKSFTLDKNSKEVEKGIDGFLDGTKYSIISFLSFESYRIDRDSIDIGKLEKFVMENANDRRLVLGFFYYALRYGYHTPQYKEWTQILKFDEADESLYTASLFISSLVGKAKSNLYLNLDSNNEKLNDPQEFTFNNLPSELNEFILKGLKTIGYYVLSKELVVYAFHHETSTRWFFIRSIISLDAETFKDVDLIYAEFINKSKLSTVYKPFFDNFDCKGSFEILVSIFSSLTRIYFVPEKSVLKQTKLYPLVHDCLYGFNVVFSYPPTVPIENNILDSLLAALSKQKYFPITFFTFFSQAKLTDQQFNIVKELLTPKTHTASNFFNYLLPSAYFIEKLSEGDADNDSGKTISLKLLNFSVDKESAIHFSNKPPSFSRAFYRSLMLPFMPILPQKLIVQIKDLLCPVFNPLSYKALNAWGYLNDFDQIILEKYPDDIVEHFKEVGFETIEIYNSVMNDPSFDKKKEITNQLIKTSLSLESNMDFTVKICDAFISHNIDLNELLRDKDVVNSPHFCCFCVFFSHAKRMGKLNDNLADEVTGLFYNEEKKDLFENRNQKEPLDQVIRFLSK